VVINIHHYKQDLAERFDDRTANLRIAFDTSVVSALLIYLIAEDGHLIVTDIN